MMEGITSELSGSALSAKHLSTSSSLPLFLPLLLRLTSSKLVRQSRVLIPITMRFGYPLQLLSLMHMDIISRLKLQSA